LQTTPARITVCEASAQGVEHRLHIANALTHYQLSGIFQCGSDFFTAWYFTNARASGVVGEDEQVACEESAVRA
jgi:hypothetical protein